MESGQLATRDPEPPNLVLGPRGKSTATTGAGTGAAVAVNAGAQAAMAHTAPPTVNSPATLKFWAIWGMLGPTNALGQWAASAHAAHVYEASKPKLNRKHPPLSG